MHVARHQLAEQEPLPEQTGTPVTGDPARADRSQHAGRSGEGGAVAPQVCWAPPGAASCPAQQLVPLRDLRVPAVPCAVAGGHLPHGHGGGHTWPELVSAVALPGGLALAPTQQAVPGLSALCLPRRPPALPRVRPLDPERAPLALAPSSRPPLSAPGTCIVSTGRSTGVLGPDRGMWCRPATRPRFSSPWRRDFDQGTKGGRASRNVAAANTRDSDPGRQRRSHRKPRRLL